MSSLQELLSSPTASNPTKVAIQTTTRTVTYAELQHDVARTAAGLAHSGIAKGDRVAWMLPNCIEAVVLTLACYRIGAVVVPLNYRYVAQEADDVLQRVGAKLLVFHSDKANVIAPLIKSPTPFETFVIGESSTTSAQPFSSLLEQGTSIESTGVAADDPALILFTSGSTGHPKGVVHSHAGAYAGIDTSRQIFDFKQDDVLLVGKPISHAGGLQTQLMAGLMVGSRSVLLMKPKPEIAVATIRSESVTEYGMLASDLLDFIEYLEAHPQAMPTLKNSIGSGDAVPTDLHHRFRDLLGWEVMEGAGMTEIGGYYAVNPRYGTRKWGSLGLPTPGTSIRVLDAEGNDCPVGQTGEIVLKTASATIGYWNDAGASAELFRGGWLHSGDLGYFDAEGYLWFVGRKKLMIVRRGSNIAPPEVEAILDEHPLVHASVVLGLSDDRDGQIPVACVALMGDHDASTEESLRQYVADHLAAYKNPVHYLFVDEMPRNATGKFDRNRLKQMVDDRFGG